MVIADQGVKALWSSVATNLWHQSNNPLRVHLYKFLKTTQVVIFYTIFFLQSLYVQAQSLHVHSRNNLKWTKWNED
jgi:hypothetical protein